MTDRLATLWARLQSSYWFVPAVMCVLAAGLAAGALGVDHELASGRLSPGGWSWAYAGGADGARALLSSMAGSAITVAATAFSLTMVMLTLAANQFGPRLIRNFLADRGTQLVLGTFTATFLYCILVLRTVRGPGDDTFVPHVSVAIAVGLGVLSLAVLIYFVHHVAVSTQVNTLITSVGRELNAAVDRLFPAALGRDEPQDRTGRGAADLPSRFDAEAVPVLAPHDGYVQRLDDEGLLSIASSEDLVLRLAVRPGAFVARGEPIVHAWPPATVTAGVALRIEETFIIGSQRTPAEDLEFSVLQLVEIAIRALSAAINDPFTAAYCVDRLGASLARLLAHDPPSMFRYDRSRLRVVAVPASHERVIGLAFDQVRLYGAASPVVMARALEAIERIAGAARPGAARDELRAQADAMLRAARAALPEDLDRRDVEAVYERVLKKLEVRPPAEV